MAYTRRVEHRGVTLVELLVVVTIIGLLATIAIPNLLSAQRKAKYSRAASDSKTLVGQAMLYANDRGTYPTSVAVIRNAGYTNIPDVDPWNISWQLSPVLVSGGPSHDLGDVYVFSKGASGAGVLPAPFVANTGDGGSVGYSSVYGSWSGT